MEYRQQRFGDIAGPAYSPTAHALAKTYTASALQEHVQRLQAMIYTDRIVLVNRREDTTNIYT